MSTGENMRQNKKVLIFLLVALLTLGACGSKEEVGSLEEEKLEDFSFYMDPIDEISQDKFSKDLDVILGKEENPVELGDNERLNILRLALDKAGFLEFANTLDDKEVEKLTEKINYPENTADEDKKYIASLIQVLDINPEAVDSFINEKDEKKDLDFLNSLSYKVLAIRGKTSNFIGYAKDKDIYEKINRSFNQASFFTGMDLAKLGTKAISEKVSTGYNIKYKGYNANFNPEKTLKYGHSDIKHANQLIALLNKEDMNAKIQIEPKTSVFQYMLDWGPIPEPTETYEVVKVNEDLYLANALEFDLLLEFDKAEDKEKFDGLINRYAKKDDDNPDGEGLLYGSWWQPLYTSESEMGEGYEEIVHNIISKDGYELHSFTMIDDKEAFEAGFKKLDSSLEITSKPIWCDEAFYRYLNGDFQ